MNPDIKLRDYYINFIANAKKNVNDYIKDKEYYTNVKELYYKNLKEKENEYVRKFKIYIDDPVVSSKRAEWLIGTCNDSNSKELLLKVIRYGNAHKKIEEYTEMINIASHRSKITYRQYESYIMKYYNGVHRQILTGKGYKFNAGIGTLLINRWPVNIKKRYIDYQATRKNKEKLIAMGKKLYNEVDAKWHAKMGIPYDGVDYRVFRNVTHDFEIDIFGSKIFTNKNHNFRFTQYVNIKFKGMSYIEMANICNNIDEIVEFPVDIKYKVNMLLHKYPENYINFIRNENEDRRQFRENYR